MGLSLEGRRFQSRNRLTIFAGTEIMLLRPGTFMNESGKSIKACVDFYHLEPQDILIIHDDLDLSLGRLKMVRNGGTGGHKGVRSIIDHVGSRAFYRLKIGIGRPRCGEAIEDYVLSPFYKEEEEIIEKVLETGVWACKLFISQGVDSAMNQINCLNLMSKDASI